MKYPVTGLFLSLLSLSFVPSTIAAESFTSLSQVAETAEDYVTSFTDFPEHAEVQVKAKTLDKRLKLKRCLLPLNAHAPTSKQQRLTTVKVTCPDADGWSLYVPVETRIYYSVVTASIALEPLTSLGYDNLKLQRMEAASLRGNYFTSIEQLAGARTTRRVGDGQPLRRQQICQVCRDDIVTIYARSASLELKTSGKAIGNGSVGDTIRVQNSRSERMIDAEVIAVGEVQVNL
nr:flagellar basal body P-ring formation chaperone FlgA [Ferrimonas senticii]